MRVHDLTLLQPTIRRELILPRNLCSCFTLHFFVSFVPSWWIV